MPGTAMSTAPCGSSRGGGRARIASASAVVVGRDGAALAGRDDLARVEREAAGDAEPAAGAAAEPGAERAGRVLEQRQRPGSSSSASRAAGRRGARRARPSCAASGRRQLRGSTFIVAGSTSTSTGRAPAQRDDVRGRRERVGGDDHLVARPDPEREHGEVERGGAGRDRDRVRDLAGARDELASNSSTSGPIVSCPLSSTAATAGELLRPDVGPAEPDQTGVCSFALVPRDRPGEPLVELDLRLEAEQLARLVDVRDAQLDVGVVERLEDDLARAAGRAA